MCCAMVAYYRIMQDFAHASADLTLLAASFGFQACLVGWFSVHYDAIRGLGFEGCPMHARADYVMRFPVSLAFSFPLNPEP